MMHRAVRTYLRKVAKKLPYTGRQRSRYLKDLRIEVQEFAMQKPNITVPLLCERFGDADTIARRALDTFSSDELLKKLKKGRTVLGISLATAAALILGVYGYLFILIQQNANAVYTIEVRIQDEPVEDFVESLREQGWSDDRIWHKLYDNGLTTEQIKQIMGDGE